MNIIKVLEINSVCGLGSTGRIVVDLYRELEKYGHTCVIAYGRGNAPSDIKTIKFGCNLDNYVHGLKTRLFDKQCFSSKRATENLIEEVKKYNPDIIHLHNLHGYYINIEILFEYLKESNKQVIWTLHDCWAFTGHCSYFDYVGCANWKNGCGKCIQKCEYPSSKFIDNSRWNYEKKKMIFTSLEKNKMKIVTPSRWLAGLVKQSFLSKYNISVINNGINLELFKPTNSDFRKKYNLEKKFIILGVANVWDRRKGLEYFCELSKKLDENYKVVLVGINNRIAKKLPENIMKIEKTDNIVELAKIYTAADIYVNPTLEDNYPTTNLEAICCGTPIITFNSGGSGEAIEDCGFGIIVEKKNFNLLKLSCENIKLLKKIKSNMAVDREKYDKKTACDKYIKLIDEL